jgi:hypothetical protein
MAAILLLTSINFALADDPTIEKHAFKKTLDQLMHGQTTTGENKHYNEASVNKQSQGTQKSDTNSSNSQSGTATAHPGH